MQLNLYAKRTRFSICVVNVALDWKMSPLNWVSHWI